MRLLIVEDEPTLGTQLKNTLEGAGYAVDLATDGEDGHYLGSTESYDAIILDLGLPEIDGLTVLDRWRKEGKTFPVLVLTARDSWSDKVAGLDAGADDYLAKPFQTEELIARLRALIRRAAGNASAEMIAGDVRLDTRVASLRVVPGLTPETVRAVLGTGVRGLVLSTYGTGTLPGGLVPCLEEARAAGVVVLAVSQCLRGHVELGRYEAGAAAEAAGVVSGGGMTVEAGLAKMMVGLGRLDTPEALRAYLVQDTLGELS